MDIESKIKLKDLVPADYNPRIMYESELIHLKNSIDNFGLVDPIIINLNNNRIIGGHQRYKILKEEGENKELNLIKLGEIGWVFTDTDLKIESEDHEKALNIALNKIKGRWDNRKLDSILDSFDEKGFDVELTGFDKLKEENSVFDLDGLIDDNEEDFFNTVFTDMDDIEELESEELVLADSKITLKIGDYSVNLETSTYNYWIRQIEKEHNFNLTEVKEELKRRLKL